MQVRSTCELARPNPSPFGATNPTPDLATPDRTALLEHPLRRGAAPGESETPAAVLEEEKLELE